MSALLYLGTFWYGAHMGGAKTLKLLQFKSFYAWVRQKLLNQSSLICTTTTESRTITFGFFGIGLPHLGVEALVAMSNK